jgi:hypothetical protein
MEEALRLLPGRLRDIRLDGQPSWREGTGITGPTQLPLRYQPAPGRTAASRRGGIKLAASACPGEEDVSVSDRRTC